ncbi:SUKH-4 family immunity protein [Achromobacter insuavis]
MNHDELAGLYAGGTIRLAADLLANAGLDTPACAWLLDPGLPVRPDPALALVEFVPPTILPSATGAVLAIAREPWADALWLAVASDGRVVTAGEGATQVFVNTRVEHFLYFLATLQRFQAEAGSHDPGPRVYTQSEMRPARRPPTRRVPATARTHGNDRVAAVRSFRRPAPAGTGLAAPRRRCVAARRLVAADPRTIARRAGVAAGHAPASRTSWIGASVRRLRPRG